MEEDDDEYSEEEILEDNTEIIFTKDISKTSFQDFVGKTYLCDTVISSEEREEGHIICEMVNNHTAVLARIANKIPTYGFGQYIIDTPKDTPRWLTFDTEQYAILVLKLKIVNKYICLLRRMEIWRKYLFLWEIK